MAIVNLNANFAGSSTLAAATIGQMACALVCAGSAAALVAESLQTLPPLVEHTAWKNQVDEDGDIIQEALFTNLNDQHALFARGMSLIGRTKSEFGPAESIPITSPFALGNAGLTVDLSGYAKTSDLAAEVAAQLADSVAIAALQATVAAQQAQIAAMQAQIATLQRQVQYLIDTSRSFPTAQLAAAGASAIVASVAQVWQMHPSFAGAGAMAALVTRIRFISAALAGTGGGAFIVIPRSANLSMALAGSALVPDVMASLTVGAQAALVGTSALASSSTVTRVAQAALAGTAAMIAAAIVGRFITPLPFSGSGVAVFTMGAAKMAASAALAGSGVTSPTFPGGYVSQLMRAVAPLAGAGGVAVSAIQKSPWLIAALAGAGGVVANTVQLSAVRATFAGAGAAGWASVDSVDALAQAIAAFAGTGTQSVNATSGYSAFDPAHTSSNVTLSNNNLTATASGASPSSGNAIDSSGHSSGKYYFEANVSGVGGDTFTGVGIVDNTNMSGRIGNDAHSVGLIDSFGGSGNWETFFNGTATSTGAADQTGVIGVAIDIGTRSMWFRVHNSSSWLSGNPNTGTSPSISWSGVGGPTWYPAVNTRTTATSQTSSWVLNVGKTAFLNSPPSGFSAWG